MQAVIIDIKNSIRVQLRFVLPILPLFNVAAACALARLLANARKGTRHGVAALAALALLAGSICAALLITLAAYHNYPGAFQPLYFVCNCQHAAQSNSERSHT